VGWAVGDGQEHGDDPGWDAHEAGILYDLLEKEVIHAFYVRDSRGIPKTWIAKMRLSMLRLTPKFSSNRAVREYVEKYYLPAAAGYCERTANESSLAIELCGWSKSIAHGWSSARFGSVETRSEGNQYAFHVQVFLGGLDPNAVAVELYAEPQADGRVFRQKMELREQHRDSDGSVLYSSKVPANRPVTDYTARVVPFESRASIPLEATQILWQK
jgi:starch phosphorylase